MTEEAIYAEASVDNWLKKSSGEMRKRAQYLRNRLRDKYSKHAGVVLAVQRYIFALENAGRVFDEARRQPPETKDKHERED